MSDAPTFSVLIPAYDVESFIEPCLDSVAAQTWRDYEVVVVDDGSRDATWEIVSRLHLGDPRVRGVRFKRNFGQHPAMHAGFVRARADIVRSEERRVGKECRL